MTNAFNSNQRGQYAIVGDIGGTNARFGCIDLENFSIHSIQVYPCRKFHSLSDVLLAYQADHTLQNIKRVSIAIACPVYGDWVEMTNLHWRFSIQQLKQELALTQLMIMNDFSAAIMSLNELEMAEKVQIGSGGVDKNKPAVLLGAGTGLGLAYLIPTQGQNFIPLPSEGGHVGWSAQTEQEWFIHQYLSQEYGHVSVERLLSGSGLENIYRALSAYFQKPLCELSACEIAEHAMSGESALARAAVDQFFASLGCFAGNLALTANTFGGVYIAGGIVPKLMPLMFKSEFRSRFEAKGRFREFNRKIATYVITNPYPGLLGAAVYLKNMPLDAVSAA